ncbi:phage tail tube protein [Ruminiclostridium cellobioparum]|jgi:hypothetical protein|uniref:phage tail tube protein n=3 Tax=Ruminiclostridium cellobioparum TaxID=29355 RepID=UPI00055281D4|nr:phage tail tube protein [Ruminiclostridium cellobioparum]
MDASKVMNGSWGEVWMDGEKISECTALQAKIDIKKEDVPMCGRATPGKKLSGWEGKGSMKLNKVNSRMAIKIGTLIRTGQDIKVTIVSKLADPAAYGAERIVLRNASFDDLTLADWAAQKNGEVDCPFTFEDFYFMDVVAPQ